VEAQVNSDVKTMLDRLAADDDICGLLVYAAYPHGAGQIFLTGIMNAHYATGMLVPWMIQCTSVLGCFDVTKVVRTEAVAVAPLVLS
jgi:hypothetical protein